METRRFSLGAGWDRRRKQVWEDGGAAGRRPQESGGGAARSRLWVWDLGPVLMGAACSSCLQQQPPPSPLGPGTTLSLATSSTLASLPLERLLADAPVRCPEASWDRPCRPQGELFPIAGPLPSQRATLCRPPTCLCPPSHRSLPSRSPQGGRLGLCLVASAVSLAGSTSTPASLQSGPSPQEAAPHSSPTGLPLTLLPPTLSSERGPGMPRWSVQHVPGSRSPDGLLGMVLDGRWAEGLSSRSLSGAQLDPRGQSTRMQWPVPLLRTVPLPLLPQCQTQGTGVGSPRGPLKLSAGHRCPSEQLTTWPWQGAQPTTSLRHKGF